MSEQNTEFEKWAETNNLRYQLQKDENGTYLSPNTYFHFMGWQSATTEANKRIAELQSEVAAFEAISFVQMKQIEELQSELRALKEVK